MVWFGKEAKFNIDKLLVENNREKIESISRNIDQLCKENGYPCTIDILNEMMKTIHNTQKVEEE
jgi:hypothetical protein